MELVSIRQYADSQHVSYEAVRKQIVRYDLDLKGHIIRKGRTQYLDDWAVDFLTTKRKENPIVILNSGKDEEIQLLKDQLETLRVQLMTAQNERLKAQDRIIELQDEAKKTIEDRARFTALLEDNEAKGKKLKEAEDQIMEIRKEREADLQAIQMIQKQADELRKKNEDLQKQRDEAQTEAGRFKRSIFGFYRKT